MGFKYARKRLRAMAKRHPEFKPDWDTLELLDDVHNHKIYRVYRHDHDD